MLKIRLQRTGRSNYPSYRIVVAEHARPVKGKYLEILGYYLPTRTPVEFTVDTDKVGEWLKKGAHPTDTMARLLKKYGVKGMEKYMERYTKQKGKNPSEVPEAPAAPAPAAAAPVAEEKATEEAPAVEETKEEVKAEEPAAEEAKEEPKAEEPAAA